MSGQGHAAHGRRKNAATGSTAKRTISARPRRRSCSIRSVLQLPNSIPTTLWRRALQKTQMPEVLVHRHNEEALLARVSPDRDIGTARQPAVPHVGTPRKDIGQAAGELGREVLVEQQPHAAGAV